MMSWRRILILLAVPASALLGLHEIAGTSIYKGSETEFQWSQDPANDRIVLSSEPGGDMTCLVRLLIPTPSASLSSMTETRVPLEVSVKQATPGFVAPAGYEWIEISKKSSAEPFNWPAGRIVSLIFAKPATDLKIVDWQVVRSDKSPDTQEWAFWRRVAFWTSLGLLALSITGGIFEALEKFGVKREPLTPESCLEKVIENLEGKDDKESKRMKTFLKRVLFEAMPVDQALAPFKLSRREEQALLFRARNQLRAKLQFLITELTRILTRVP